MTGSAENDNEGPEDEYVTFQLADDDHDQNFEISKRAILQDDGYDQDLCDFLHRLLKWPRGYVSITGLSVDNGGENDATSVDTIDELRHLVGHEETVFQLHVAGSQALDATLVSQRDYRTHWIFKLEDLAAQLSCDGRDEAEHMFALIRRNHRHSKDFIQDLMALFKPLRDRVDEQWYAVGELMALCEKGVNMDAETALGFRAWIGHFSNQNEQDKARAYLSLVELKSPIMAHGVGELIKLFRPADGFWADLRGTKEIFRTIDLDAAYD